MFLRLDVYPAAVFSRLGGIDYDPGEAFLLSLPLLPLALAILAAERWLFGKRPLDALGLRHRSREPLPLGTWRGPFSLVCWAATGLALLPIAALAWKAASGGGFVELPRWIGGSLANSLLGAAFAATAIVALGAVLGHASARRLAGARAFDLVGVLTFVTPAVLLGVGLIALWNRPATQFVYGGMAIIVLGYVARYGIIGIRTIRWRSRRAQRRSNWRLPRSVPVTFAACSGLCCRCSAGPWGGRGCLPRSSACATWRPRFSTIPPAESRSRYGSSPWRPADPKRS